MAKIATVGSVSVYLEASDPSTGAGFVANLNDIVKLANGARYVKNGAADTAWNLVPSAILVGSASLIAKYAGLAKLRA